MIAWKLTVDFDSFREENECVVDEALCLDALALAKLLYQRYSRSTTGNLLALFCFHLARIPEKIKQNQIIPFFEQDKTNWNRRCINLGFHYLEKPERLHRYYLESLMVSTHMLADTYSEQHWLDCINLYTLLLQHTNSPIIQLNLCYCLYQSDQVDKALTLLDAIEKDFPSGHTYFTLVKAHITKSNSHFSQKHITKTMTTLQQEIRRVYIKQNLLVSL